MNCRHNYYGSNTIKSLKLLLMTQGEICVAGSRVYVQEGIYDQFVKKAAEAAKNWSVGDPFNPNIHQGPQVDCIPHNCYKNFTFFCQFLLNLCISICWTKVDKAQFEKVLKYIEIGKKEGATVLTGGNACGDKGYYIEPTIFTDVKVNMSFSFPQFEDNLSREINCKLVVLHLSSFWFFSGWHENCARRDIRTCHVTYEIQVCLPCLISVFILHILWWYC